MEIERTFVLKEFTGLDVEQFLLEKSIEVAREKGVNYIWIGVSEKDQIKMEFYQNNNFVEFDRRSLKHGNDEQTFILMKLEIKN